MSISMMERSKVRSIHNLSSNRSNISKSFVLPNIHKQIGTEISISSSKLTVHPKKIINISQKIQKYKSFRLNTEDVLPTEENNSIIR